MLDEKKSVVQPLLLSHGTLMCRNLADSRRFYEEFLGLEVVRHARPAMMLRLRSGMYVVCVCRGEHLPEQHVLTHWGVNVASREEVERAHAEAHRLKEKYGIRKITKDPARAAHDRSLLWPPETASTWPCKPSTARNRTSEASDL